MSKKLSQALRISSVSMIIIALFWSFWFIYHGQVPSLNSITVFKHEVIFPFGISRFWDVLIGPIWATLYVLTHHIPGKLGDITGSTKDNILMTFFCALFYSAVIGYFSACSPGFWIETAWIIALTWGWFSRGMINDDFGFGMLAFPCSLGLALGGSIIHGLALLTIYATGIALICFIQKCHQPFADWLSVKA